MSITEINRNPNEDLSLFSGIQIKKNIILILYIALCPIFTIFSIIWYLFNIIKSISKYLFLNCNDLEKDLENQYIQKKIEENF